MEMLGIKSSCYLVVPTIRPESMASFIGRWNGFVDSMCKLIVVEDAFDKSPELVKVLHGSNAIHLSWSDIENDLGSKSWIISRRSDAIRSYGILHAYRLGAKVICTMDDDCYPPRERYPIRNIDEWIAKHMSALNSSYRSCWTSSIDGDFPRGYPYGSIYKPVPTCVNHGLWHNIPDFDAITQLQRERSTYKEIQYPTKVIDRDVFFPMCSMNVAWRREMTPCMYFMLMGSSWPFDRFGDIWCGMFMKKVADHLGLWVSSGDPCVWHERASDPFTNLRKEVSGLPVHEELWKKISNATIKRSADTVSDAYTSLIHDLDFENDHATGPEKDYWKKLAEAIYIWIDLCSSSQ